MAGADNTQDPESRAIKLKLDELIRATPGAHNARGRATTAAADKFECRDFAL